MKKRIWFFESPPTTLGDKFNTENKPTRSTFEEFLNSIPFFLEDNSIGTVDQQGLFKIASTNDIANRGGSYLPENPNDNPVDTRANTIYKDKAVMPYHLPLMYAYHESVDDANEKAAFGIGVLKRTIYRREDFLFKFRADTLVTTEAATTSDFVILSKPLETSLKNRSVKMTIDNFMKKFGGTGGGVTDIWDAKFIPPTMTITQAIGETAENIGYYEVTKNGIMVPIESLDHVTIVKTGCTALTSLSNGQVKIAVQSMESNHASIDITYSLSPVVMTRTLRISKAIVNDQYYINASPKTLSFTSNSQELSLQVFAYRNALANVVAADISIPSLPVYLLEVSHSTIQNKKTFIIKLNPAQTLPPTITFNVQAIVNNEILTEEITVLNNIVPDKYEIECADTMWITVEGSDRSGSTGGGVLIDADALSVKIRKNGNLINFLRDNLTATFAPDNVTFTKEQRSSGEVAILVSLCPTDNTIMTLTYALGNVLIQKTVKLRWKYFVEDDPESGDNNTNKSIVASPNQLVISADNTGAAKSGQVNDDLTGNPLVAGSVITLKGTTGLPEALLVADLNISTFVGATATLSQLDDEVLVSVEMDAGVDVAKFEINLVDYPTSLPIGIYVTKTKDGVTGDPFTIDAQGTVTAVGAGYIGEDPGFTYLDTTLSLLHFKIGAAGVDTWSAGAEFGRGATGATGPAPAHQWVGTTVRFQNPNGTWPATYTDLEGPEGAKGTPAIPVSITIDPATGKGLFTFDDGLGGTVSILTNLSIVGPKGDDGTGEIGPKGDSFIWKGELTAPPANPVHQWVYRNSISKATYVYNGNTANWDVMVNDGIDGSDLTATPFNSSYTHAQAKELTGMTSADIGRTFYITDKNKQYTVSNVVSGRPVYVESAEMTTVVAI